MQPFQISGVPPAGPKNYVFVDEHNRHKRLKVMRACEGCRRRKIKCDAATSNSWPCAACKRLKLTCVPPVGGVDGDLNVTDSIDDQFVSQPSSAPMRHYPSDHYQYLNDYSPQNDLSHDASYDNSNSQHVYQPHDFQYATLPQEPNQLVPPLQQQHLYGQQRYPSFDSTSGNLVPPSVGSPQSAESVTAEDLAESLGDLRIADGGFAAYIRQQSTQQEAPAPILEDEEDLPAFSTAAGSQIRIPPALMPTDEEASTAFQDFFRHVHPYVPVLCRSHFYHQWQRDRNGISPLLLEAVFACAGQVSDDPAEGSQWLALANRHEENFADTPRLSTIQALLLLLKAREKAPKKGYFYRSWVTVRKIVGMAKDLELHEHHDIHTSGGQCDSSPVDCLIKTRVWQSAMIVELMVGGPQGRSDYSVDVDSIDISPTPPNSHMDDYEKTVSRQFAYFVRNIRNIRGITETYHKLKRKNKDWAKDPIFLAYNEDFRKWPENLPADLNVSMPLEASQQLSSHFLANMHCHYQLGIVMLYKPQLNASKDFANDEKWKMMFSLCYQSAKKVCLYQEAILEQFNVLGLACMVRGLSFPIYAILSCVMVHMIAITNPDSNLHLEAKNFFIRHMRVLERCIAQWPMPEVEAQINGLRSAFSADVNRPFDLKPSFPYDSPSESSRSPETRRHSEQQVTIKPEQQYYQQSLQTGSLFPTPPISATVVTDTQANQMFHEYERDQMARQYHQIPPTSNPTNSMTPAEQWNPTPIIDQFATAFAIPQSALAPPSVSSYGSSPPVTLPQQNYHTQMPNQQYVPSPTSAGGYSAHHYTPSPTSQSMTNVPTFPSPHAHNLTQPQSRTTPGAYPPHHNTNSYFDPTYSQLPASNHIPAEQAYRNTSVGGNYEAPAANAGINGPVYVTPKEWQQSVASVYDPNGLKRKWDHDQQLGVQQQGHHLGQYGRIG